MFRPVVVELQDEVAVPCAVLPRFLFQPDDVLRDLPVLIRGCGVDPEMGAAERRVNWNGFAVSLHLIDLGDFSLELICVHRASQSCKTFILPHIVMSTHKPG